MRIIPIDSVRNGSTLARTIFDNDGRILLKKGITLKENLIKKLIENGIEQLYISDEYSSVEIEDVIKPELRQKSINVLKNIFNNIESSKNGQVNIDSIACLSEEILNDIIKNDNILISLVDIKTMDNYTYQHSVNVAIISIIIGMGLNLPKNVLFDLCIGAILHDIGKIFIPNDIIKKPGSLTNSEFKKIKTHSQKGYEYIYDNETISDASKEIIRFHHEKYDGSGYPNGLAKDDIPFLARIVSVADVYDALTSNRPYRTPISPNEAIEYIMAYSNVSFDINIVTIFSKLIVPYPKGTIVALSNGDIGIIEDINKDYPLRPIVKIIESINETAVNSIINLLEEISIVINNIKYYV